jgi:RNA polymerase primary sigma factor
MDVIRLYLKDIKDIPLLTPEEEKKLAKQVKRNNKKARQKMIQSNLRLVINIAKRYKYFDVPIADLIEEGNLGLMRAVKKFEPNKGYRFSTYASWWIRQYITRAIANQGKTIRVPVYMSEIITRWKKVTEQLSHKLSRRPKIKEVAKKMKMSEGRVRQLNEIATKASSLDAPIGQDGSGQFMDLIEDKNSASPKDELSKMFQKERINSLLELISEREREIINLRFGLKDGFSHTLGQTAEVFGITRERVRQIENAAMRKLKIYLAHREGVQVSTLEEDKKRKRTLRKKRAKRRINQKNKRNSKKSKKKKSKRRKKSKKKIREKKRKTKQGRTKKKRSKKKKSKK